MKAIVAVDENWGIGFDGEMLFHIPEDLKRFKALTTGKVVVMGRATFDSLPGRKPLKNRTNIVLTKNKDLLIDSVIVCHSLEDLLSAISIYDTDDVFIIGGQHIYTQLYDSCNSILVTKIKEHKEADTFFPNLDLLDYWVVESQSEESDYNGIKYTYYRYQNTRFQP